MFPQQDVVALEPSSCDDAGAMPIYVYRCERCGREVEELQKFTDPPPVLDEDCVEGKMIEDRVERCDLRRVPSAISAVFWPGDYNNDGRGGWQRQGDAMVKLTPGKNTTRYGDGSV